MLSEQLSGVRALGVELLRLLALAIQVPVKSLSAFVLAHNDGRRLQGWGVFHLRVHPAECVVARRGLDPLSVV